MDGYLKGRASILDVAQGSKYIQALLQQPTMKASIHSLIELEAPLLWGRAGDQSWWQDKGPGWNLPFQTLSVAPEVPREWFSQRQEGKSLCDPLSDLLTQEAG